MNYTEYLNRFPGKFVSVFDSFIEQAGYPFYNICVDEEGIVTVELAVAGFTQEDLAVFLEGNELVIKGEIVKQETNKSYSFKGISSKNFERRFKLRSGSEVSNVRLTNGILEVSIKSKELTPERVNFKIK